MSAPPIESIDRKINDDVDCTKQEKDDNNKDDEESTQKGKKGGPKQMVTKENSGNNNTTTDIMDDNDEKDTQQQQQPPTQQQQPTKDHHQHPPPEFIEIKPPKKERYIPEKIEVYVTEIQPKFCGRFMKELNALAPLRKKEDNNNDNNDVDVVYLGHLRRVRRVTVPAIPTASSSSSSSSSVDSTTNNTEKDNNKLGKVTKQEKNANKEEIIAKKKEDVNMKEGEEEEEVQKDAQQLKGEPPKKRKKKNQFNNNNNNKDIINNKDKTNINNTKDKTNIKLEILLGTTTQIDKTIPSSTLTRLITTYELNKNNLEKRYVPGRPAQSKKELESFNAIWPTLYHHEKTREFEKETQMLTYPEICSMKECMMEAIKDAYESRRQWLDYCRNKQQQQQQQKQHEGVKKEKKLDDDNNNNNNTPPWTLGGAIIVNPNTNQVVSRASMERCKQQQEQQQYFQKQQQQQQQQQQQEEESAANNAFFFPDDINPLCTSVLLAIQGVSRLERLSANGRGMDSEEFQKGQYLCTGYDLYTTIEPNVYEAMALVHSRVRRVVFGVMNVHDGGLGGSGPETAVHFLPGTNHHYRAFRCSCGPNEHNKRCSSDNANAIIGSNSLHDGSCVDEQVGNSNNIPNGCQSDTEENFCQHEEMDIFALCSRIHSHSSSPL